MKTIETKTKVERVLIVDDHPVMRYGLGAMINAEPDMQVCGEAEGEESALVMIETLEPTIMVVDIALKEGGGIELIKKTKSLYPDIKMLVVSMHDETLFGERALRAGSLGYVNKQEVSEQIVTAIRTVSKSEIYISQELQQKVMSRLYAPGKPAGGKGIAALSDRELDIFIKFGEGKDVKQIAKILGVSVKTVETHRTNMIAKLDLAKASDLMREAIYWVQVEKKTLL